MSEKMEELVIETKPMEKENAFGTQVEMNAQRAEEDRMRRIALEEERKAKQQAEEARKKRAAWEEGQRAKKLVEKRARRAMNAMALALTLIIAGGIYLNYVDGFPMWIAATVAVGGMSILAFVIGWIFGHRARRY